MTVRTSEREWLRRWDRQQEAYIRDREGRFEAITEVLCDMDQGAGLADREPVVLDLGCGPGSTTDRVLRALPAARVVAVDLDPVLIELARRTTTDPERVRHVEADLSVPGWHEALRDHRPAAGFDAIVSTTALHWLAPGALVELYRTCHDLIRPGGVLFNGDHMPYARSQPALAALSDRLRGAEEQQAFDTGGVEDYAQWHRALRSDRPDLDWREREHRFPTGGGASIECGYTLHVAALTAAGFTEVDTIWQRRDSRVLLAVAGSR